MGPRLKLIQESGHCLRIFTRAPAETLLSLALDVTVSFTRLRTSAIRTPVELLDDLEYFPTASKDVCQ